MSIPSIKSFPPVKSYSLRRRLAVVDLPQPECPTSAIFLVAGILKFMELSTFWFREGYWKSALTNSISPFLIIFSPYSSLVSILDGSSMIAKIVFAAFFALSIDGAWARETPVPIAATKRV